MTGGSKTSPPQDPCLIVSIPYNSNKTRIGTLNAMASLLFHIFHWILKESKKPHQVHHQFPHWHKEKHATISIVALLLRDLLQKGYIKLKNPICKINCPIVWTVMPIKSSPILSSLFFPWPTFFPATTIAYQCLHFEESPFLNTNCVLWRALYALFLNLLSCCVFC